MTLKECYAAIGGDYENVIERLRSERLVQKFVLRFLDDNSFELLCDSMENKNYNEAFRASHTIKGICQNLSFNRLYESSYKMTEALRYGYTPEAETFFSKLKEDYKMLVETINKFQNEMEEK